MTLEERKIGLINWITKVSSEEVLEKIEQIKGEENWFDSLPAEVQEAVWESKAQGDKGEFQDTEAQYNKLRKLL